MGDTVVRAEDLAAAARRYTAAVVAREVVRDVVVCLGDIDVMPLKGVLLQQLVYDPADRSLRDVDIAVRSRDFKTACGRLLEKGYVLVREEHGGYEVTLRTDRFPLCVDLHRRFAASRRFRLTPNAMFSRGRVDEELFGCRVVIPDDYDVYSHLLAHSALDYVGGAGWHRPEDLTRLAAARHLAPAACARRLEEAGLARWARFALRPSAPTGQGAFAHSVVANLKPDSVGEAWATLAATVHALDSSPPFLRSVTSVLLNPTLPEAAIAVLQGVANRVSDVVRTVSP